MVLEPLVLESREELAEKIPQWKATLETLDFPESEKRHLRELLTYAIVEKFSKLTSEEIEKMLKLTPQSLLTSSSNFLRKLLISSANHSLKRFALNPLLFIPGKAGLPRIFKD